MSKRQYHIGTVILGIITALIIVLSQVFFYQGAGHSTAIAESDPLANYDQTDGSEESGGASSSDVAFISLPSSTVLSSFQPAFQHPSVFLFELPSNEEESESWIPDISVFLGKYFQTLFHVIISPNAP